MGKKWKRFLLVGCSHGQLADRRALDEVLKFKREFKPHFTAHLGDFTDTTAWRSGASDTADEGSSVADDMASGLQFLTQLEPQAVFIGNHEHRIWRHADSPSAIVREAARSTIANLHDVITNELKARFIDHYSLDRSWMELGGALIGHGWMFGLNAIRDHAEHCNRDVIIAHLHRLGMERARAQGGATGYCVGYLGDPVKFNYADSNRSKARWQQGFAWGEFTDSQIKVNLQSISCQTHQSFPRV